MPRKQRSIHVLTITLLVFFLIFGLVESAMAQTSKPIEISYVTFLPKMSPGIKRLSVYLGKIEKHTKGQIVWKHRGGPESIAPFDQPLSVKSGAVDAAWVPAGYYAALVPAAPLVNIAQITFYQEKETGAYDFLQKLHERVGLQYVFRENGPPGGLFTLMSNKHFENSKEMAGLRMMGGSLWTTVAPALGMKPLPMSIGEGYSALERGVIDVMGAAYDMIFFGKYYEVAKYLIQPTFCSSSVVMVMNLKKWNSMPKSLQDSIIDAGIKLGPEDEAKRIAAMKGAVKGLQGKGMKLITFKGADAEQYLKKVNGAVYDFYAAKAGEDASKLYSLLKKK